MPFSKQCSVWINQQDETLNPVSANCEREQYGRYHEGSSHGRCSDGDLDQYEAEFAAACCNAGSGGDGGQYCPSAQRDPTTGDIISDWALLPPVDNNGNVKCTSTCRTFFEEVYAECHPRFEAQDFDGDPTTDQTTAEALLGLLSVCQGMQGGGNRRSLAVELEELAAKANNLGFLKAMLTKAPAKMVKSAIGVQQESEIDIAPQTREEALV